MSQTGPTVCIIDDDESVRKALRRLIRSFGWKATVFATAEEFLEAAPQPAPGCLVLDVHLPGLSGPELHQRLLAEGRHIPVVFITGYPEDQARVAALREGAVPFLQKPIEDQMRADAVNRGLLGGPSQPDGCFPPSLSRIGSPRHRRQTADEPAPWPGQKN